MSSRCVFGADRRLLSVAHKVGNHPACEAKGPQPVQLLTGCGHVKKVSKGCCIGLSLN
jgi:hypothetical protein